MSHIIKPAKPNWKITILIDSQNQLGYTVEDQTIVPGVSIPRQMNQIEVANIFNTLVASILQMTLKIASGRNNGTQT